MNIINLNAFNNEFFSKIIELNKNFCLLKSMIEEENKFDPKYKTELCKKFQSTGKCPYGYKCRFAHGKEELLSKSQGLNYKKNHVKHLMKEAIALMAPDAVLDMMKEIFQKPLFHIFIFNYFYLKCIIFILLKKLFIQKKVPY